MIQDLRTELSAALSNHDKYYSMYKLSSNTRIQYLKEEIQRKIAEKSVWGEAVQNMQTVSQRPDDKREEGGGGKEIPGLALTASDVVPAIAANYNIRGSSSKNM